MQSQRRGHEITPHSRRVKHGTDLSESRGSGDADASADGEGLPPVHAEVHLVVVLLLALHVLLDIAQLALDGVDLVLGTVEQRPEFQISKRVRGTGQAVTIKTFRAIPNNEYDFLYTV